MTPTMVATATPNSGRLTRQSRRSEARSNSPMAAKINTAPSAAFGR